MSGGPLERLRRSAPVVVWLAMSLAAIELVAIILAPMIVPGTIYLRIFLPARSIMAARSFVAGEAMLLPDSATGWRNRPDTAIHLWAIDSLGSRSTRPATWARRRPVRVVALGSSTMNGGELVSNSQTLSAYLETDSIEALNFATMLYGPDQVYLQWRSRLHRLKADVIVVGLDVAPESQMVNVYIPLLDPNEPNMPYVKPRFRLAGDSVELVRADPQFLLAEVPNNQHLVDFFEQNDAWAWVFDSYRRFGMTPGAAAFHSIALRVRKNWLAAWPDSARLDLAAAVLRQFRREAEAEGSRVAFLYYPHITSLQPPPWKRMLPDGYDERLRGLRRRGVELVDVRALLRASGLSTSQLFSDGVHFTARANRIIAEGVRPLVRNLVGPASRRAPADR